MRPRVNCETGGVKAVCSFCRQPQREREDDVDELYSNTFRDVNGRAIYVCEPCQQRRLENWRKAKRAPKGQRARVYRQLA